MIQPTKETLLANALAEIERLREERDEFTVAYRRMSDSLIESDRLLCEARKSEERAMGLLKEAIENEGRAMRIALEWQNPRGRMAREAAACE